MPRFDGTGPRGRGPMTGGGMGYCVLPVGRNYTAPLNRYPGGRMFPRSIGGRGTGMGLGRGLRGGRSRLF